MFPFVSGKVRVGIKTQLMMAFGGGALLTVLTIVVALFSYQNVEDAFEAIVDTRMPAIIDAQRLASEAHEVTGLTAALIVAQSQEERQAKLRILEDKHQYVAQLLERLRESQGGDLAASTIPVLFQRYRDNLHQLNEALHDRQKHRLAVDNILESAEILRERLDNIVNDILETVRVNMVLSMRDQAVKAEEMATLRHMLMQSAFDQLNGLQSLLHSQTVADRLVNLLNQAAQQKTIWAINDLRTRFEATAGLAIVELEGDIDISTLEHQRGRLVRLGLDEEDGVFARQGAVIAAEARLAELLSQNQEMAAEIGNLVNTLVQETGDKTRATRAETRETITANRQLFYVLIAITITGLALITYLYAGRYLVGRITALHGSMARLSQGQLDIDIPVSGYDEITDMAATLEVFRGTAAEAERSRKELLEKTQLLELVLENMGEGLTAFDKELRLITANRRFGELYNLQGQDLYPGRPFADFLRLNAERGEYGSGLISDLVRDRLELAKRFETHRLERERPDGSILEIRGEPMPGGGFVTTYRDVTEIRRAQKRIEYMAEHDALTGLPNRPGFFVEVRARMKSLQASGGRGFFIFLDLNDFKDVNDAHGHKTGDILLEIFADTLRGAVNDYGVVGRFGGDEFVVFIDEAPAEASLKAFLDRFYASVHKTFDVDGIPMTISASLGSAAFPQDGDSLEVLLRKADMAMYRGKGTRRNAYVPYTKAIEEEIVAKARLKEEILRAVAQDEFELYYQPQVCLRTDQVLGAEALIRWTHPEDGIISPIHFIPAMEEMGMIRIIDEWVMNRVLSHLRCWDELEVAPFNVSLNMSSGQFNRPDLVSWMQGRFQHWEIQPNRVTVEITEGTVLADVEHAVALLAALREQGVRFALDDFGTGYSSLAYLKTLPVDELKIDRSFVAGIAEGDVDRGIVQSVIDLAKLLNLRTVAEGVEEESQWQAVKDLGCDLGQGFLKARPMNPEDFLAFMERGNRA